MDYKLNELSYDQLKKFCRDKKLKGFSKYKNKTTLKDFILNHLSLIEIQDEELEPSITEETVIEDIYSEPYLYNKELNLILLDKIKNILYPNLKENTEIVVKNILFNKLKSIVDEEINLLENYTGIQIDEIGKKKLNLQVNIFTDNGSVIPLEIYFDFDNNNITLKYTDNNNYKLLYTNHNRGYLQVTEYAGQCCQIGCNQSSRQQYMHYQFIFEESIINETLVLKIIGIKDKHTEIIPVSDSHGFTDLDMLVYSIENKNKHIIEYNTHFNQKEHMLYESYKEYYTNKYNTFNEQILVHGTSKLNLESVLVNGLTLVSNRIHGKVHGNGIYFTNDLNLALKYPKTKEAERYVIVVKCAVNKVMEGRKALENFPIEDSKKGVDTCVDSKGQARQFIKKNPEQYKIVGFFKINLYPTSHDEAAGGWRPCGTPVLKSSIPNPTIQSHRNLLLNLDPGQQIFKIVNKTLNYLHIFWNKEKLSYNDFDLKKCIKKMVIVPGPLCTHGGCTLTMKINEELIIGYYDTTGLDKSFIIYKIITVGGGITMKDGNKIFYIE